MDSDFRELLKAFNDNGVEYLIIGGYAVIEYTEPYFTKDLDVWVRPNPENAIAVYKALKEFGAPLIEIKAEDFADESIFYQMGRPPFRIDIMMAIPGVSFEDAWPRKTASQFEDEPVYFIAREDLIENKLACNRKEDRIHIKRLRDAVRFLRRKKRLS